MKQEINSSHYLIFGLHNQKYAFESSYIKEIVPIPELTPADEVPAFIPGIFNFRGKYVPVIDINLRICNQKHNYSISDKIIILNKDGFIAGFLVEEVYQVVVIEDLAVEKIDSVFPSYKELNIQYVQGVSTVDDENIIFLNLDSLLTIYGNNAILPRLTESEEGEENCDNDRKNRNGYFFPDATDNEIKIFKGRAKDLRQNFQIDKSEDGYPVAVLGLIGELVGVKLDTIQGFSDVKKITQVPCCPNHILGQTNYRGEILTIVDISPALNSKYRTLTASNLIMIIKLSEGMTAIPVEEILDIHFVQKSDIKDLPVGSKIVNREFIIGTVKFNEKMISILDIEKILSKGNLAVNEEV